MAKGLTVVVRAIIPLRPPHRLLRKKLKLQSCYFYSNCYAKNISVNKKKKKKLLHFRCLHCLINTSGKFLNLIKKLLFVSNFTKEWEQWIARCQYFHRGLRHLKSLIFNTFTELWHRLKYNYLIPCFYYTLALFIVTYILYYAKN